MNKSGIEWCDHTWNPITGCGMAALTATPTRCHSVFAET